MKLTHWSKNGLERLYIDGLPGTVGSTYVCLARGKFEIRADDITVPQATLLATLAAHAGVPAGALGQSLFDALKAKAKPSRAAAAAARPVYVPVAQRAYGTDLAFENIDNELEVTIEVDHREPPEIDAILARAPNTRVTRGHLAVADYRLNDGRVLVERKSVLDFAGSVLDGRLFDQAQRIGMEPDTVGIVLIEGDVFRLAPGLLASQVTGAISCLSMIQGMTVINTLDLTHTAYVLAKFAQHQRNGLGYELPSRKDKPKQLLDAQRYVLEGITGVNAKLAGALLAHFGSVRAVATADEKALREVAGIGPKIATNIVQLLAPAPR